MPQAQASNMKSKRICIIGAGLSGLSLAWKKENLGHKVQIKLRMAFEGRRKFLGLIKGVEGDDVVVVVDDHEYLLPFDSIEKANIVPVFE